MNKTFHVITVFEIDGIVWQIRTSRLPYKVAIIYFKLNLASKFQPEIVILIFFT